MALATRGSPATDDPADLDIAEFFVLRKYRRLGVGRAAASALWDSLPGHWIVRVADTNQARLRFWTAVVRAYTGGAFGEDTRTVGAQRWHVLTFTAIAARPGRS